MCSGTQFEPSIVEYFSRTIVDYAPTKSVFSQEYLDNVYQQNKNK